MQQTCITREKQTIKFELFFLIHTDSSRECDNGKMTKMKADWIQDGGFKDVTVTLKVLKYDKDFQVSGIKPFLINSC